MMANPGKNNTIYQMGRLMRTSWVKASDPHNIIAGFKATGIWPFDRHIFTNDEFLPASVTDRPDPTQHISSPEQAQVPTSEKNSSIQPKANDQPTPGPSGF